MTQCAFRCNQRLRKPPTFFRTIKRVAGFTFKLYEGGNAPNMEYLSIMLAHFLRKSYGVSFSFPHGVRSESVQLFVIVECLLNAVSFK